ncbi:MAG: acyl-[acyl-carrier-protein]--UDP-N-acetylglucosamine O-acyltransferase [Deltaproteobacteria bacterium]|nr:MAG: acyl-[acyl-carrier-protein]--UDP-N-acetylglucosamine O-acyltransferase [Deltaproteobacteria bacterium]
MIHPSAIIDPEAQLGEGVDVGPFSVIGPKVTIGDRCSVSSHVQIASHVRMGKENRVFSFASIGAPPQDLKFKGENTWVEIGDGNTIREYVTVNRGTAHGGGVTRLGSQTLLMAYSHIAHDCQVGDRVVVANAATLAGHVEIGAGAIIGGLVGIHQFVRIGEFAMVGALSGVPQDVPPYVTAVVARPAKGPSLYGLNLIGLKRNKFSEEAIAALKQAYRILFRSGAPMSDALAKVDAEVQPLPEVRRLVDFIRSSKRGVLR